MRRKGARVVIALAYSCLEAGEVLVETGISLDE